MAILENQRSLFDIPDHVAYFNCAYNSPQLNRSTERLCKESRFKSHPWNRTPDDFFENAEIVRTLAASIFGGDSDGYAIIPSASYGLSTAARIVETRLKPGRRILIMEDEFPSNYLPWKRAADVSGAEIIIVRAPLDGNWTRAIIEMLDESIQVAAVSGCHWTNGAFIDLNLVGQRCREVNAVFAIDATQSLGAMPISLDQVKPDFLVAAGYKWLLSPYGFGLLYVSEKWRNSRPLEESWLARNNAHDFTSLADYSDIYMDGSRRFDVGEKCTSTILPGAIEALEQIKQWGVSSIADTLADINGKIARSLEKSGFQLPPNDQRCPHMICAALPESYKGDLVKELRNENIFISQRGNSLRFAPHLHVSDHDLKRLLESIENFLYR